MATSWDNSYSLGIRVVDDQHKKLFEMIDAFYDQISKSTDIKPIIVLVKGLKEYAKTHFSAEEMIMKKHDFPGFIAHKAKHDKFIEKAAEYEDKLMKGAILLPSEIVNFVKTWIVQHIKIEDRSYSMHMEKIDVKKNYL